jgi:histone H4
VFHWLCQFTLQKIIKQEDTKKKFFYINTMVRIVQGKGNANTGGKKPHLAIDNGSHAGLGKTPQFGQGKTLYTLGGKHSYGKRAKRFDRPKESLEVPSATIRKIARQAGVGRISGECYEEYREGRKQELMPICLDIHLYAESARRKTITAADVIYAANRHGIKLYI